MSKKQKKRENGLSKLSSEFAKLLPGTPVAVNLSDDMPEDIAISVEVGGKTLNISVEELEARHGGIKSRGAIGEATG